MPDPTDPANAGSGDEPGTWPEGMPRWVKAFVIAVLVLALLVVILLVAGGGDHGPGRHLSVDSSVSHVQS